MRARRAVLACVAVVAGAALLGACGDDADDTAGYGHVEVSDLPDDDAGHFTAAAQDLTAELVLHANGCVNVLVDGVERHPLWPDGTRVTDEGEGRYVVALASGTTLEIDEGSGARFTARGVIDDAEVPLVETDAQGKVGSLLAYCDAPGEPVAFTDADSIEPVEG